MRRFALALFVLVTGLLAVRHARADAGIAPSLRYTVQLDEDLARMDVRVCFPSAFATALIPGVADAAGAVTDARAEGGERLRIVNGRIELAGARGRCVSYRLDVERALRGSRLAGRFERDMVSSPGAWLWRPPTGAPSGAELQFVLPDGMHASVPWPRRQSPHGTVYTLDASAFSRPAFVSFGRSAPLVLERHGVHLEATQIGAEFLPRAEVEAWLTQLVDGVSSVQGRFPVDRLTVLLLPSIGRGIDFGMVRRGGGHSVAFFVGESSGPTDLVRSWVGWHELSHLLLPSMPQRDAWLYEGLATYYQEVLRARAGVQSPDRGWSELVEGFDRGSRTRSPRTLASESEEMMRAGTFSRVYWSGTAFMLEADVELRRRGSSLDRALAHGARSWRGSTRVWTSDEICAQWDRTVDAPVLRPLRARYVGLRTFPDVSALLAQLGIRPARRTEVALATIRDAIMQAL